MQKPFQKEPDDDTFVNIKNIVCFNRLERVKKECGASHHYASNQYKTTVRPMYEQFIKPTMRYADVIVNGEDQVGKSACTILKVFDERIPHR